LTPAHGKKKDEESYPGPVYYAADGQGNFPFFIDPSKTEYFTVRQDLDDDLILPDTHGSNMVAEQTTFGDLSARIIR
jgi:hypothetical protein